MKVTSIKHADVRGKELFYLKFENSKGREYVINVGQKTAEEIKLLEEEERVPGEQAKKNEGTPNKNK